MSTTPRLVVSAPASGNGKTAVSVGLLAAFAARGLRSVGFKIGPDQVDAAYLGLAAGRAGRNLDPRMVGIKRIGPLFQHGCGDSEIAVVEGTMGLYDGLGGRTDLESTAQLAGLLRAPVVLVVDVAAMGQSVAALIHGFRSYDELLWLGGVILNRVASDRHEKVLREALDDIGVPVLGVLRRHALSGGGQAALPPRQNGVPAIAHGNLDAIRSVRRLGEVIARNVEIERLLSIARSAPRLSSERWSPGEAILRDQSTLTGVHAAHRPVSAHSQAAAYARPGRRPVVAVAGTARLSYGYIEASELLTAAGADVVYVDPLTDGALPPGTDALVVGGALAETYAEDLAANVTLARAVAALVQTGRPVIAEGTGLIWLCREFGGRRMCGVLDAVARPQDLMTVGYREATAAADSYLYPAGTVVTGYKLHRSHVTPRSGTPAAWTWAGGPPEGFIRGRVHASYLMAHWAGVPAVARQLVAAAAGDSQLAVRPTSPGPAPVSPAGPDLVKHPFYAEPPSLDWASPEPAFAAPGDSDLSERAAGGTPEPGASAPEAAPAAPEPGVDTPDPVAEARVTAESDIEPKRTTPDAEMPERAEPKRIAPRIGPSGSDPEPAGGTDWDGPDREGPNPVVSGP